MLYIQPDKLNLPVSTITVIMNIHSTERYSPGLRQEAPLPPFSRHASAHAEAFANIYERLAFGQATTPTVAVGTREVTELPTDSCVRDLAKRAAKRFSCPRTAATRQNRKPILYGSGGSTRKNGKPAPKQSCRQNVVTDSGIRLVMALFMLIHHDCQ